MSTKPNLLFLYELSPELYAQDGLHSALEIMRDEFDITKVNIKIETPDFDGYDFVLGHSAWESQVEKTIRANKDKIKKCGLCIGGNINPPYGIYEFDALFCETNWYLPQIKEHPNASVAFGIDKDLFSNQNNPRYIDYLGVGAFAKWKRWELMSKKEGVRLIVGEIQKYNPLESMAIVGMLVASGVGVLPNVSPKKLSGLYNSSKTVYLPALIYGGSERAALEARQCGCEVIVEDDNLKLKELLTCEIPSAYDYASKLLIGINKVI